MKRRQIGIFVIIAMLMFTVVGCKNSTRSNGNGSDSDKIYIGVALPYTGSVALNGELITEGIELAVQQCNDAGGIDGKLIELIKEDDKGEPKEAANVANKFVGDERIVAVIGHLKSSCTLAGAPIYNEGKLLALSPDSSSPDVTHAGDYIFRIKNSDVLLAQTAAQNIIDDGYKKPAVFYENNDYGYGGLAQARIVFEKNGIPIVCEESIMPGEQKDFSTAITNLKNSGADALQVAVDYNETGLLAKQMKAAGVNIPIYGTDGLYTPALIEIGGDATEGIYCLSTFYPDDPAELVQQYKKDYETLYGNQDGVGIFSAEGYDAANLVIEAIRNAGPDREAIRDYMATIKGYKGVIGEISFDENGDVNIPLLRLVIKNGKFELAK